MIGLGKCKKRKASANSLEADSRRWSVMNKGGIIVNSHLHIKDQAIVEPAGLQGLFEALKAIAWN